MTSKEFLRRTNEFSKLDLCPYLNFCGLVPHCYKIVLVQLLGTSTLERFDTFPSLDCFTHDELKLCQSLYIDNYPFSQFQIDLGYFKSFYNRLSQSQKQFLFASHKVDHLLDYCAFSLSNNS